MEENCFSIENFHINTVEYLELRRDTLTAKLGAIKEFFPVKISRKAGSEMGN